MVVALGTAPPAWGIIGDERTPAHLPRLGLRDAEASSGAAWSGPS